MPAQPLMHEDKSSARYTIMEAAASEFEKKGFQATTLDDIASVAGVARRTIYHHFNSKKEILEAACIEQAQQFLEEVRRKVKSNPDFPEYVIDCLYYVIDKAPESSLYMLKISKGTGLDPVSMYFGNTAIINEWVELFQEPYVDALRKRQINPEIKLVKLVNWFGRISTSYLQYPLEGESKQDIRESLEIFLMGALRHNS